MNNKEVPFNQKGFTLIEVIVSIAILGLVATCFLPLFAMSFKTLSFASSQQAALQRAGGRIEAVAANKYGVLFADGSFVPITDGTFPIRFVNGVDPADPVGGIVSINELTAFLANIPSIKLTPYALDEGYQVTSINIQGTNTHFISGQTTLLIKDQNDHTVSGASLTITSATAATLRLPSTPLRNPGSPYYIVLTTGSEKVSTLLPVNLPVFIAAGENGTVSCSADGVHWQSRSTGASTDFKAITCGGNKTTAFVAVGSSGKISYLQDGRDWTTVTLASKPDLAGVCWGNDMFVAVGSGGTIFTSPDASRWTKRDSGTDLDLYAVACVQDSFLVTGKNGVILYSNDGIEWGQYDSMPVYRSDGAGGNPYVQFNGTDNMLMTELPFAVANGRSIFACAHPEDNTPASDTGTLLGWGIDEPGRYWIMNFQPANEVLRMQIGSESYVDFKILSDLWGLTLDDSADLDSIVPYALSPEHANGSEVPDTDTGIPAGIGNFPQVAVTSAFKGALAEILVYDHQVSSDEVSAIMTYLYDKYALGSDATPDLSPYFWLDASSLSPDHEDGDYVSYWPDSSGNHNDASSISLNAAAACTQGWILAGDYSQAETITEVRKRSNIGLATVNYQAAVCSEEQVVAAGNDGVICRASLNSDLDLTWAACTTGTSRDLFGLAYSIGRGMYAVVGENGTLLTSTDGNHWTSRNADTNRALRGIAIR